MTPEMRTRSPAFNDVTSASDSGVCTSLTASAPVLTLTASLPFLGRGLRPPSDPPPIDFLGGGLRPPSEPPPIDGAGPAGARANAALRHTDRRAHSVISLCRCAWHSISSEGGCAPLPNLPPSMAPAQPALEPTPRSVTPIGALTA